jgi:phosphohistidine phosphatase
MWPVRKDRPSVIIYLVHHGDAVGPEIDPARPLSPRGRAETDLLAQKVAARGVKPDVIWHSGKARAKQTAEMFWRRCNPLSTFAVARGLQPADPPSWIADAVAGEEKTIMLVGHFPHLPRLLALLSTGNPDVRAADFPIHGIVALEELNGKWIESWRLNG